MKVANTHLKDKLRLLPEGRHLIEQDQSSLCHCGAAIQGTRSYKEKRKPVTELPGCHLLSERVLCGSAIRLSELLEARSSCTVRESGKVVIGEVPQRSHCRAELRVFGVVAQRTSVLTTPFGNQRREVPKSLIVWTMAASEFPHSPVGILVMHNRPSPCAVLQGFWKFRNLVSPKSICRIPCLRYNRGKGVLKPVP
jgi:hypothetical protein